MKYLITITIFILLLILTIIVVSPRKTSTTHLKPKKTIVINKTIVNDKKYKDPLLKAIQTKNLKELQMLVKEGADINNSQIYGYKTPLKVAVDSNDLEIVKFLINKDYDPMENDSYIGNDYVYVIEKASLPVFKYITKTLVEKKIDLSEKLFIQNRGNHRSYVGHSPLEYILATHDIKKINYTKSLGINISQEDFVKRVKSIFSSLNFPYFLKLIHYGYPKVYSTKNYYPHLFVIEDPIIIDYIYIEPVESFASLFQIYKEYSNKLNINKDFFFKAMENYLKALIKVNYQEEVGNNGFIRLGYYESNCNNFLIRLSPKGCEDKLDEKTAYEEHLWTLKKFFYRRGEFIGMLCTYYALKILDYEKNNNKEALRLYITYGKQLQDKYNNFANQWNKGIYPDKSQFEDINYLKSKYKKLPISSLSFKGYPTIKPLQKSLYVNDLTPFAYYYKEIEKIKTKEDYQKAINKYLRSDNNGGSTSLLALRLLLKAKYDNMPEDIIHEILLKYQHVEDFSDCNYYDCIQMAKVGFFNTLCNFGLFEEALYIFNDNHCEYCIKKDQLILSLPFSKVQNKKLSIELPFKLKDDFKKTFIAEMFSAKLPMDSSLVFMTPLNVYILDSQATKIKLVLKRSANKLHGKSIENGKSYILKGVIGKYGNFILDKYKNKNKIGTFVGYFYSPDKIKGYYWSKSPLISDYYVDERFIDSVNYLFIGVTDSNLLLNTANLSAFRNQLKKDVITDFLDSF